MESLAENVLSPMSIETHLKAIEGKKFSIATDASNKGNIKLFPIGIQYFDVKTGIKNFVLDFYDDPNEKSEDIYNRLKTAMKDNNLSVENLIGFTGDNASVNYGIHHSVYRNLKEEIPSLIKANCNAHVLHNTIKYALLHLPFDVENLVLKVYSHFSVSAKRVQELKSCYEFTENEFENMKRHVVTRWLSLYPAVIRIIDNLKPLKSHFIGSGTDNCPQIINDLVWSETYHEMTIFELYLHFSVQIMKIFHITIKIFEQKSTNASNLFDLMFKLKTQLENRINCEFIGSKLEENLKYFSEKDRKDFKLNAKKCYERALKYLMEHFDFDSSPFKLFSALNLDSPLNYDPIIKIPRGLQVVIDEEIIFDEINSFNVCLAQINASNEKEDTVQKFVRILSQTDSPNLVKVIETVMAIPISNDFVEKVFSHMTKIWTDERNRMSVGLIKAEICIKNNFSIDCLDFKDFIQSNQKCIKAAKSDKKYSFKSQ